MYINYVLPFDGRLPFFHARRNVSNKTIWQTGRVMWRIIVTAESGFFFPIGFFRKKKLFSSSSCINPSRRLTPGEQCKGCAFQSITYTFLLLPASLHHPPLVEFHTRETYRFPYHLSSDLQLVIQGGSSRRRLSRLSGDTRIYFTAARWHFNIWRCPAFSSLQKLAI